MTSILCWKPGSLSAPLCVYATLYVCWLTTKDITVLQGAGLHKFKSKITPWVLGPGKKKVMCSKKYCGLKYCWFIICFMSCQSHCTLSHVFVCLHLVWCHGHSTRSCQFCIHITAEIHTFCFLFFFTTIFLLLCLSLWSERLMMYYSVLQKGWSVW